MIAYIKGRVAAAGEEKLILEAGNMGYNILMPLSCLESLRQGQEVKIYTHLNVREDAMQLFGFLTKDDLDTFRLLLGVNGIGPKAALGILSGLTADELRFAILADDVKTLSRAPGIGKKTAQKLILELKDKITLEDAFERKTEHVTQEILPADADLMDARKEAAEALTALGYSGSEALRAVKQITLTSDMSVETILKLALKNMSI
ncbi:MAG: Holliday junction branch migration protein RuvA [Blautia sp.]